MNRFWKKLRKSTGLMPILLFPLTLTGAIATPLLYFSFTPPTLAQTQFNSEAEADRLLQQGFQQFQSSQYQEARQSFGQALTIYRNIGNLLKQGNSLTALGAVYAHLGEYQKAFDYYQQSLAISRNIGDHPGQAVTLGNIGGVYLNLGEYQKAFEYQQQSLAIYRNIGDRRGQAFVLGNIGIIFLGSGEYQKSYEFFSQSLSIIDGLYDCKSGSMP